jgi:copper chaperone CopZ
MATRSETLQVSGIRCERCVNRLAVALRSQDGLESANANLMGQVQLEYDDEKTTRDVLVAAMAKAGFRELEIDSVGV